MTSLTELRNRFTHHPPKDLDTVALYEAIRDRGYDFAAFLHANVPEGREKSLAITHLEEVVMWANAGIARSPS